ncbi:high affinity cGMP-specific 3',5'-cyclic phosphodiesterase 9A [Cyclospora cayetanensis]|uniref:Phosphodiesterase n=1 Tax=Cyclospora cayetanensis TaxID=88456 RepID=A0A6P6RXR2_9EIME|nr:high affinity cGMP-specific 3',5'-cyclic phosphodiesterase 9A [Cyclospora cayetanensis]
MRRVPDGESPEEAPKGTTAQSQPPQQFFDHSSTTSAFFRSSEPLRGESVLGRGREEYASCSTGFANFESTQPHVLRSPPSERSRGPRFNAFVDVVYYDSKASQQEDIRGRTEASRLSESDEAQRHTDFSPAGSSEEAEECVPPLVRRPAPPSGGSTGLMGQSDTAHSEREGEFFRSSSDIENEGTPLQRELDSIKLPCSSYLPRCVKLGLTYIVAINRDSFLETKGPYRVLRRRFKSLRPLMFKREKIESEFADLNSRRMPLQVLLGAFLLTSVRVAITASSIKTVRLGTLGLFSYNCMGLAEAVVLLLIPYHLASIRYAFCFWLTLVVMVWAVPICGLSAKLAAEIFQDKEEGFWFWSPTLYFVLMIFAIVMDQSCFLHEQKRRVLFWKLKTADDRLELLEDQIFHKRKRKQAKVPSTPLESVLNNIDLIQGLLLSFQDLDEEKERVHFLLNEARHNLTLTDNIYQFNAETCSDKFARSYVSDLRREGISRPRTLSRMTSLAARRRSRLHGSFPGCLLQTLRESLSKVGLDWNFSCITLGIISHRPIFDVGYTILSPFSLSPDVSLDRKALSNFLQELNDHYKDNPYHNALHGATVCHMTLCLLEMLSVRDIMSDFEDVSACIASLSHDVGHPGRNNNFMIAANTPLAITYNDESVLENHHAALTFRILSKPQCNILEKVSQEGYRLIRKLVIGWILETDMKKHFDHIASFRTRRMNAEFSLVNNEEDRSRTISMCIKAADLGHAATDWEQHQEWCRRVYIEFYEQGDEEAEMGLPKSFLCDRSVHDKEFLPAQIGFITFVVKPLYEELKAMDDTLQLPHEQELSKICIANLEANVALWQKKEKEAQSIAQEN